MAEALCRLTDILNSIDQKKKDQSDVSTTASCESKKRGREEPSEAKSAPSPFDWIQYFDAKSMRYYYYNTKIQKTQWEIPPCSFIPYHSISEPQNVASQRVAFNTGSGSFCNDDTLHRPRDREGRQMSAFFDISTLEENRKEAKAKKDKLSSNKSIDWAELRQSKKKRKDKLRNQWLQED